MYILNGCNLLFIDHTLKCWWKNKYWKACKEKQYSSSHVFSLPAFTPRLAPHTMSNSCYFFFCFLLYFQILYLNWYYWLNSFRCVLTSYSGERFNSYAKLPFISWYINITIFSYIEKSNLTLLWLSTIYPKPNSIFLLCFLFWDFPSHRFLISLFAF